MKRIKIHDKVFEPYLSEETIQKAIKEVAQKLHQRYIGKQPVFIGVLNGSFFFAADLLKHIDFDCEVSFVKVASYQGTKSSGNVRQLIGLDQKIQDRHVIIVEDVVDTGNTVEAVREQLQNMGAKSIAITTLLFKPTIYEKEIPIEYPAIEINPEFVVGYGLDYNGKYRELPYLAVLS